MSAAHISDEERELLREHVQPWKWVGPTLDEMPNREIEAADTQVAIRRLFPAKRFKDLPKRTTSGLIEQQALFTKLR
jgi:hypothetical protein